MKTKAVVVCVLALTCMMLVGCASGPRYKESGSEISEQPSDMGRIYVYRTAKFGLANQPAVRLNGRRIGKAVPEGYFYVDVEPGRHELSVKTDIDIDVEAGETYYVRLNAELGMIGNRIEPELVHSRTGREEIRKTKYIGD